MAKYLIQRFELWGNAKDGFDTNNVFTIEALHGNWSGRQLLTKVRDLFEGLSFNWSENRHTFMSRLGITINDFGSEGYLDIQYRGHTIGQIEYSE